MSILKLVCLSMMAKPTNTITTRMMREIVNLKAAEKNLLYMLGLLDLKKIKTKLIAITASITISQIHSLRLRCGQ